MAKTLTISDIITKLTNVYKYDMYILNYKYCIAGIESDNANVGQILTVLNDDLVSVIKEVFPEKEIIFISDMKKSKTDMDKYIQTEIDESIKSTVVQKRDNILSFIKKIEDWKSFDFDEAKIKSFFKNGETVELFSKEKNIPSVTISKSLFPLVTDKKFDRLYYNIIVPKEKEDLTTMVTTFDFDIFQMYSIFLYMDLD